LPAAASDGTKMFVIGVPAEGSDEPRIGLSPETAKKLIPDDYTFNALQFDKVSGEIVKKEGELRFVPTGSDKGYLLIKYQFEEKPKTDPFDDVTKLFEAGTSKVDLSGEIREEKKEDGKVILKVAVMDAAKSEEKK